jgi:hypothetical protein
MLYSFEKATTCIQHSFFASSNSGQLDVVTHDLKSLSVNEANDLLGLLNKTLSTVDRSPLALIVENIEAVCDSIDCLRQILRLTHRPE